ncbi:MAG: endonuclease/exonuclease/phosphatase family protein [Myxococcales bacterium]|nr:endonuclease/exonuclease/phosphatase family protein [Myxococcales bacterium]
MRSIALVLFAATSVACASSEASSPAASAAPGSSAAPEASATSTASAAPTTLDIASYNVLYALAEAKEGVEPARAADPATLERARTLEADLVLFQETNDVWEAALRAVLSERYPYCTFHPPRRYLPEGLGACARQPLLADTSLASPLGWFPAQRLTWQAPGGAIEVVNVHLRPAVAGSDTWWATHRETRPLRRQEVEAYLRQLPAGAPALVVGDYNEVPEGDLFRALDAAGFAHALPGAGVGAPTWHWAGTELGAQLDHVAYRADAFELVAARVLDGGRSDHVPVVVTLARREPGGRGGP